MWKVVQFKILFVMPIVDQNNVDKLVFLLMEIDNCDLIYFYVYYFYCTLQINLAKISVKIIDIISLVVMVIPLNKWLLLCLPFE